MTIQRWLCAGFQAALVLIILHPALLGVEKRRRINEKEASRQVQAFVASYERQVNQASRTLRKRIDKFRLAHQQQVVTQLVQRLLKCEQDADRLHLAYHILRRSPLQPEAMAVYQQQGLDLPFHPDGGVLSDAGMPQAGSPEIRALTQSLLVVDDTELAESVGGSLPSYRKKRQRIDDKTFDEMVAVAAHTKSRVRRMICTAVCFYQPGHKSAVKLDKRADRHRSRWIDPFDRYLQRYGLMGRDLLRLRPASGPALQRHEQGGRQVSKACAWVLPGGLKQCALDVRLVPGTPLQIRLADDRRRGLGIDVSANALLVRNGDKGWKPMYEHALPAAEGSRHVRCLISPGRLVVLLDGQQVGQLIELPMRAYKRVSIEAASDARIEDLALLNMENPLVASRTLVLPADVKPETIPVPAWMKEREQQREIVLTLAMEEVPLQQAAADLARLAGVHIELAESAALVGDLPVTILGEDLTLQEVFDWFERYTQVVSHATEKGFRLAWD